jgi:hypothetical protein
MHSRIAPFEIAGRITFSNLISVEIAMADRSATGVKLTRSGVSRLVAGRGQAIDVLGLGMDPYIVALAETEYYVVVTDETSTKRPNRKIPGVCLERGIRCITLDQFVTAVKKEASPTCRA